MKIYPKNYVDLYKHPIPQQDLDVMGVYPQFFSSFDEYVAFFTEEIKKMDDAFWLIGLQQVWLEFQFTYKGERRVKRLAAGFHQGKIYSRFNKTVLGRPNKYFLSTPGFAGMASYYRDFYPDLLDRNPFETPEQFKFPYKNIGVAHLEVVHKVHNRLELLAYAEEKAMNFTEFMNWVTNQIFSYNDEMGSDVYVLTSQYGLYPIFRPGKITGRNAMVDFSDSGPKKKLKSGVTYYANSNMENRMFRSGIKAAVASIGKDRQERATSLVKKWAKKIQDNKN